MSSRLHLMSRSKLMADDENQTKCWIATHGWRWMEVYFDSLPLSVRQRLRNSPFNLCPACSVTEFLPEVQRHSEYSRESALLAAIEIMESQLRRDATRMQCEN